MVYSSPVRLREVLEVFDRLLFALSMEHVLHDRSAEWRRSALASQGELLPVEGIEVEYLKIV